jgi:predicted phosphoribosyltransferase
MAEGESVVNDVGIEDGTLDGTDVGLDDDGLAVGETVVAAVGLALGANEEGLAEGMLVGAAVGLATGLAVG